MVASAAAFDRYGGGYDPVQMLLAMAMDPEKVKVASVTADKLRVAEAERKEFEKDKRALAKAVQELEQAKAVLADAQAAHASDKSKFDEDHATRMEALGKRERLLSEAEAAHAKAVAASKRDVEAERVAVAKERASYQAQIDAENQKMLAPLYEWVQQLLDMGRKWSDRTAGLRAQSAAVVGKK